MPPSRRSLLVGAAALGLGAIGLGAAYEDPPLRHRIHEWIDPVPEPKSTMPAGRPGPIVSGSFASAAMGGQVGWSIAYPPGATPGTALPVALVLHGRGNDHTAAFGGHALQYYLAAAVHRGVPAFALASVDGGRHDYWHRRADGDDPQRMILDELLPVLDRRGLHTERIGLSGWSMGGYGAILLAELIGPRRCAALAVDSPALFLSPDDRTAGSFDSDADFERNDVFTKRARLAGIPIRVAIGTSDPFYAATRAFVAGLHPRPRTDFSIGGHEIAFWHHSAPAQLAFLGRHLGGAVSRPR